MIKKNFAFSLLTSLLSCGDPPVTFDEPQPTETRNLSQFPKRLQGQYLSLVDNSLLIITNNIIRRIYDFDTKIHINELDSTSKLSGDTIMHLRTNERTAIKREGDSLILHTHYVDTLFTINYDNVVRKFKGLYFINSRCGKQSWEVKKMELSNGQLSIGKISVKRDIENLKEFTETPQDTVPHYEFKPTKKQFKKFIRNEGFSDSEIFAKQSKSGSKGVE
jgi:hypothetical protein